MDTISEIVRLEWSAFQAVRNVGGRASCQDDASTFVIMRSSQIKAWNSEVRDSYLQDLIEAGTGGRNLLEEKYARMMERTAPRHYEQLKASLPEITDAVRNLVEEIVTIHMEWQKEYAGIYPKLASYGRIIEKDGDLSGTSFETYLLGELLTYSEKTLRLYLQQLHQLQTQGVNLNMRIMEYTADAYGYESAAEAEQSLA